MADILEEPNEYTVVKTFNAAETIKDVERKYYINSINIDINAQSCTVKRKIVLTWGDPAISVCTSTSYDEIVLTGKEFYSIVDESYNTLSTLIYDYMMNKGI